MGKQNKCNRTYRSKGKIWSEWRDRNPSLQGNLRDYASMNELICLSNLENINSLLIQEKLDQKVRLVKLNQLAIQQMTVLQNLKSRDLLK